MSLCELSKSFVFTILTKNFGMSFVCARWGPRLLSDNHKKGGCKQVKHFCKNSRLGTKVAWQNYYDWWDLAALLWSQNQKSFSMWDRGSPPPKKAKVFKKHRKTDVHIFADQHRMILTHAVPSGQTVNVSYYSPVNILQAICHI